MTDIAKRRLKARARGLLELHQRVHCVDSQHAYDEVLDTLNHPSRPFIVSFFNAHAANLAWNNPELADTLVRADLLLRDGIGVEIGLRIFGHPHGLNMNGTDLIPEIAHAYTGRRVALFGTDSPWLDSARSRLEAGGLKVVACHNGFSPQQTYVDLAKQTEPELVVLAMGMPKQEHVAVRLSEELSHPVLIVNGGAILDFLGGRVTRAPRIMRSTGTEWIYRLYLEPRRLARRYLLGTPAFFSRIALTRLVLRRTPRIAAAVPQ